MITMFMYHGIYIVLQCSWKNTMILFCTFLYTVCYIHLNLYIFSNVIFTPQISFSHYLLNVFQKLIIKTILKWITGSTMPAKPDICGYNMRHMTKHSSLFSKSSVFATTHKYFVTWKSVFDLSLYGKT